jgi:serine/threonine-protein kinase RsbW
MDRVLICSDRPEVCESLAREFRQLEASPEVATCREEWPDDAPSLVVVDLAGEGPPVRDACLCFGDDAEMWALADQQSAGRLITALAAGCVEYLFYPVNPDELRLRWRKHRDGRRTDGASAFSGRFEITFPSDVTHLQRAVEEVVETARRMALPGSRAGLNLRVAVGEAVSNAILYGNEEDPRKEVTIRADFDEEAFRVTVADEGEGFDLGAVGDPTLPGNRDRSHGRGIFLIRELMDEVRYNERGNEVTLVLRRR